MCALSLLNTGCPTELLGLLTAVTSITEVPAEPEPSTADDDPLYGEYLVRAFCLKLQAPNPILSKTSGTNFVMLQWTLEDFSKLGTQKQFSEIFEAGGYYWWVPLSAAPPSINRLRPTALRH